MLKELLPLIRHLRPISSQVYLANSWTCIKVSHLHRIGHVMVEFSIVKSWMGVCWGIISILWIVARVKLLIALAKAQRTISLKFASL